MGIAAAGISHWLPDPSALPPMSELTVGGLLDRAAGQWPDREAIVYSSYEDVGIGARWSFGELRERARRAGRALIASGVEAGDRVAIWATNVPQWLELQFGAAYAGAILVPMNPLNRAGEVEYALGKSEAVACFLLAENRGTNLWEIAKEATSGFDHMRMLVPLGEAVDGGRGWPEWLGGGDAIGEDVLQRRADAVTATSVSQIQFTSGTTGFPKGAALTHGGIVNNGRLFAHRGRLPDQGRHSCPMPFFHCGGCVMSTLGCVASGTTQLPELTFDTARMSQTIERERCTSASMVPTMMIGLEEQVARDGRDLSSLRLIVTGGAPVPVDVERRWIERYGVQFTITYGLTETSPIICQSRPDDPEELQIATVGPPLPHVEVDVVRPGTEERVPLGEEGELRARSSMTMKGYWRDPGATAETIDPGGFLRSGDLAKMDPQGYVSITGRAKDVIIRGGENIYPAEIENVIRTLPGVADAAVVGVPDERYGEVSIAFVRLADGATLAEQELHELIAGRLARFKVPAGVRLVDAFPTTPSGKIQKFKLRDRFVPADAAS
jgi:fatty-acyl-CoA synthase